MSSDSITLMVSRMNIGPFSGSKGASEAKSVRSGPKNSMPHTVAAREPKTAVSA